MPIIEVILFVIIFFDMLILGNQRFKETEKIKKEISEIKEKINKIENK